MGCELRIVEASRSEEPHSVEILWAMDRPGAETYITRKITTDIIVIDEIRTRNPTKRTFIDPNHRVCDH